MNLFQEGWFVFLGESHEWVEISAGQDGLHLTGVTGITNVHLHTTEDCQFYVPVVFTPIMVELALKQAPKTVEESNNKNQGESFCKLHSFFGNYPVHMLTALQN